MPWSAGIYTRWNTANVPPYWVGDASVGIKIEASRHDTQDQDFQDGINACLTKDGSNAATGNLNIGNNKITNVASATLTSDAMTYGQIRNGTPLYMDTVNNRLGIGTTSPTSALTTIGNSLLAPNISTTAADTYYEARVTGTADGSPNFIRVGVDGAALNGVAYIDARNVGVSTATPLTFRNNGTERMRIDSAGDVAIGGTTPAGGGIRLYVKKDIAGYGGMLVDNQDQRLSITSNFVSGVNQFGSIQATTVGTNTANKLVLNPLGGNVLINKQSDVVTGSGTFFTQAAPSYPALLINTKDFSGTVNCLQNHHAGTYVGGVNYSNTATSFPTSSDYRLKENVVTLTDAVTRIEELKPCRFNFIAEPGETIDGFLAHEVAAIVPNAVDGEKDAVNEDGSIKVQSLDHSKLVPLLVAAVKELATRVAALEAA